MELKEFVEQINQANTELKNMREKHDAELKSMGEAHTETKEKLEAAEARFAELKGQFDRMDEGLKELQAKGQRPGAAAGVEAKSLGAQFVESEIFSEMKSLNQPTGRRFEGKDITGTAGSALALINPDRDPEVYRSIGGRRQLRIRDLIPAVPNSTGSVEIMRQASFTNNAGPQEASSSPSSAVGGGELYAKPQSNMTWELVTVPIRTLAHWVPASRQVLSDAPMLRGLIDTELAYGLQLESDFQLLQGDGAGQNLNGILQDGDINDVGQIAAGVDPDDIPSAMIDHIRAGVTECQKFEYYNMNGAVLNPVDWQTLETAKATDGHYLLVSFAATAGEPNTVWRVPVVITNAMPQGQFLVGDWQMGAKLYVREGISVRVSESHADYFVRNGVAILAEERLALAVNRPKAFCTGLFSQAAE